MLHKNKKHLNILKSISVKLDDKSTFILTYMYYTDKMNKDNNQYRYEGLIVDNAEFEGFIRRCEAAPTDPWIWGHLVSNDFAAMYHKQDTGRAAAKFFKARLKKSLDSWEEFCAKINENAVKRYPTTDYEVEGSSERIDIRDKEKIKSLLGKGISRVRDRAEKTFDIYDPNKVIKRYNSAVKKKMEMERAIAERKRARILKRQEKEAAKKEESNPEK